jgi:TPR repeat protein
MYEDGLGGLEQDEAEAVRWYRKAAEQGNADAEMWLGAMYVDGRAGLAQDYAEAVKWYRRAAEQGNANAEMWLGVMYDAGLSGLAQDHAEAVKWYRRAAEQGNANAQATLGFRYERGQGVPLDYVLADMWLSLAAAKGYQCADKCDALAAKMTPAQIAEAQRLAREWKPTQ